MCWHLVLLPVNPSSDGNTSVQNGCQAKPLPSQLSGSRAKSPSLAVGRRRLGANIYLLALSLRSLVLGLAPKELRVHVAYSKFFRD